ncbi:MAG: polysaccharide biosynthesis/export family protein [Planctomycetaceae bacterium]|nr:polysaccharide biosynthesis/export family protein [Planctomycetaceae bacterium]
MLAGCTALGEYTKVDWSRFFDPSKLIAKPKHKVTSAITDTTGLMDPVGGLLPNSRPPVRDDSYFNEREYIIGPTDVLNIGVMDLFQQGQESTFQREVTPNGFIDLPLIDRRIKADGLTSDQLRDAIKDAYSPDIILSPKVSIQIASRRQSRFTRVGSTNQGQFLLTRLDTRLIEALAISGGIPTIPGVDYLYVIRQKPAPVTSRPPATGPASRPAVGLPPTTVIPQPPVIAQPPVVTPLVPPPVVLPPVKAPSIAPGPVETKPATVPLSALERALQRETTRPASQSQAFDKLQEALPGLAPATQPGAEKENLGPREEPLHLSVTSAGASGTAAPSVGRKYAFRDGHWVEVPLYPAQDSAAAATTKNIPQPKAADLPIAIKAPPKPIKAAKLAAPAGPLPKRVASFDPPAKPMPIPGQARNNPEMQALLSKALGAKTAQSLAAQVTPVASAPAAQPVTAPVTGPGAVRDPFGWDAAIGADQTEIIAIKLDELQSINTSMNIIIRDNDVIFVPSPETGEFYVMGEISRPGVYALTGRGTTIKQAVAAAGNLGETSWPENAILFRRVANNQEQAIPVNLEKIFRSEEPDIYLKPNDILAVGTHVAVPFYAMVRGMVPQIQIQSTLEYSRNFFNPIPTTGLDSTRFTRW